ncbi:hypothetical protein HYT17_00775 [Candidatus Microgenomates bacterium]|nr:hypothetical protein [Candidatus Microgenomates bacterium]
MENKHERIIFDLKELELIRLLPGEKILCVQRQHLVALILPMLIPLVIVFLAFLIFSTPKNAKQIEDVLEELT